MKHEYSGVAIGGPKAGIMLKRQRDMLGAKTLTIPALSEVSDLNAFIDRVAVHQTTIPVFTYEYFELSFHESFTDASGNNDRRFMAVGFWRLEGQSDKDALRELASGYGGGLKRRDGEKPWDFAKRMADMYVGAMAQEREEYPPADLIKQLARRCLADMDNIYRIDWPLEFNGTKVPHKWLLAAVQRELEKTGRQHMGWKACTLVMIAIESAAKGGRTFG